MTNSSGVENTQERDPIIHMLGTESGDFGAYVEGMEMAGRRQLITSDLLPVDMTPEFGSPWAALGFVLGEPVAGDPLFRHATLPEGWRRESMADPRGSSILDKRGIRRVTIFYKAAYYDRRASMVLVNVGRDVAIDAIYGDGEPSIPWDKLTANEHADAIAELRSYAARAAEYPQIYSDRLPRVRTLLVAGGEGSSA